MSNYNDIKRRLKNIENQVEELRVELETVPKQSQTPWSSNEDDGLWSSFIGFCERMASIHQRSKLAIFIRIRTLIRDRGTNGVRVE